PFKTGAAAGYWDAGTNSALTLTNIGAGQMAQVQVFVWEAAKGATFEEAIRAGSKRGQSQVFELKTGNEGTPPAEPAILAGLGSIRMTLPTAGTVNFNNLVPGKLNAPIFVPRDFVSQDPIQAPYVAQLYAGTSPTNLHPVG